MSAISPPFSICQEELEHLNQASDEINRLELQLDVSNVCDTTTVSQNILGNNYMQITLNQNPIIP